MCFLPKSRASTDQVPGPIIAKVAPRIADVRESSGLTGCVNRFHISIIAIRVPASGVHKPTTSNRPAAPPIMAGVTPADCEVLANMEAAQ